MTNTQTVENKATEMLIKQQKLMKRMASIFKKIEDVNVNYTRAVVDYYQQKTAHDNSIEALQRELDNLHEELDECYRLINTYNLEIECNAF